MLTITAESIASSKVEGMQLGVAELARAEARMESGGKVSSTALGIMANINAMQLAIDDPGCITRVICVRYFVFNFREFVLTMQANHFDPV